MRLTPLTKRRPRAARLALVALGLAAAAGAGLMLRAAAQLAPLDALAERMLRDDTYALGQLAAVERRLHSVEAAPGCGGPALAQAAIIRAYAAAVAHRLDAPEWPTRLAQARADVDAAIACAPLRPFHWYLKFWLATLAGDDPAAALAALSRSYAFGPHEGWIARFRSEDALPFYQPADAALRDAMAAEYQDLLRDNLRRAAIVFRDGGPAARAAILAIMTATPLERRRALAAVLDEMDVTVDLPGVAYRDGRVAAPPPERRR